MDRFATSTARSTTPVVVAMAVHTMSNVNARRNNTAREGKVFLISDMKQYWSRKMAFMFITTGVEFN